ADSPAAPGSAGGGLLHGVVFGFACGALYCRNLHCNRRRLHGCMSERCPVLRGRSGGVSAAHPLAVSAGQEMLQLGGPAADAAIAAQAALCILMPDACGLGGDMLAIVHSPGGLPFAINGAGAAPMGLQRVADDGPHSITVPGIVDAWCALSSQY